MLWFVLILTLIFAIFARKRLDWAVMLTIILLPAYLVRFNIWGLPTTALELMILISAVVWLAGNFTKILTGARLRLTGKSKLARYPFDWEIAALLLVSLLAVGLSGFSNSALGLWRAYFFEPILFYLVVFNVLGQSKDLGKIIWPLSFSALGVSLVAWYQQFVDLSFLNPIWSLQMRATSIFPYANAVGLYLAPISIIILGWLLAKEKSWRERGSASTRGRSSTRDGQKAWLKIIYLLIVIFVSWGAIFFAGSEGALIGIIGALIVMGFLAGKKSAVATVIILAALGSLVYVTPALRSYAWEKANFKDLSGEIRKLQWKETRQMLATDSRWLWGAGLAGYQVAVAPWHQEGLFFNRDHDPDFKQKTIDSADYRRTHWQPVEVYLYPHNILLNFWSELGLLGLLLFVWLFIKFAYLGVKLLADQFRAGQGRFLVLGLLGAMAVIVIHGWVDVPYFKNDLAVLFWLIMAMLGLIHLWNKR